MKKECKQCGKCCKDFTLNTNLGKLKAKTEVNNKQIDLSDPITCREFLDTMIRKGKLDPVFGRAISLIRIDDDGNCRFKCNYLTIDNKCAIHNIKPEICRRAFCDRC